MSIWDFRTGPCNWESKGTYDGAAVMLRGIRRCLLKFVMNHRVAVGRGPHGVAIDVVKTSVPRAHTLDLVVHDPLALAERTSGNNCPIPTNFLSSTA